MQDLGGIINLLPDSLANQIAAGEVIQRPASAVKELMENALDAKATQIKLVLKDSGKTLIQVTDNGMGMTGMDARLCFSRHATSKINHVDDLFRISSFGFRGEALASIAAIAHVELKTKKEGEDLGTIVVIEGSDVKKQEPVQHGVGSTFSIRNLFYNTPARRKFLKSDPVELKHALEEFTRIAIPNPDIAFSVHHNDNELYRFAPSNLRQRIVNYFGKAINDKIVPVEEEADFVKISGYIGKPELIKKKRTDQYLFVNKRFIKSNYLNHAIKVAYENLIPSDHHPFYVILLEVDPSLIDINIHPTKQEVKFENERLIYNYVRVAVKQALSKYSVSPTLDFEIATGEQFVETTSNLVRRSVGSSMSSGGMATPSGTSESEKWNRFYKEMNELTFTQSEPKPDAITLSPDWTSDEMQGALVADENLVFFQIHDSYIVSPIKSGCMIIDQKAAHERILFEQYKSMLDNRKISTQKSLFPESLQISPKNAKLLESLLEELSYIGFGIEKFGQNSFVINSVPVDGLIGSPAAFIKEFLESYAEETEINQDIRSNISKSLAKNAAIKRGRKLEKEEMEQLINQLFACDMPYKSPSGHKCFITLDSGEIQSKFNH